MIALLIGGTVVLCIGLLTVVFGIPIKEFSFGNTMILAGAVVSCTGLILIGLYFLGREFRNLTRRLDAGIPAAVALPHDRAAVPPKAQPAHDNTLFARDQPPDLNDDRDEFADGLLRDARHDEDRSRVPPLPAGSAEPTGPLPMSWPDHPISRARNPEPSMESPEPPAEPAERPRRNIMFSSHRRDGKSREFPPRDPPPADDNAPQSADDSQSRDAEPEAANPFESAWPQSSRSRPDISAARNGRAAPSAQSTDEHEAPEPARERFQLPRRADASSVTIVKSGVVDSMAYSLYSDGSIEAQMPEGMVRFASIDELRAHLDERT